MRIKRALTGAHFVLLLASLTASLCHAQTLGYISGYLNLEPTQASFSTATGQIVNSFPDGLGNGSAFAVSSDCSTLYVPGTAGVDPNVTGVLNEVSATTGQVVQSIALPLPAEKVVLVGNGSKAFVLEREPPGITIVVQTVDLVEAIITPRSSLIGSFGLNRYPASPVGHRSASNSIPS